VIDLYGQSSPNVTKIVLALEEFELPYTFHHVQVWKGEQFTPAYKAINPNSKVPGIVDSAGPDGEPFALFESGAILTYLAEKCGALLPASGRARYEVLAWLTFQVAGIGPMFGQHVHFNRFEPDVSAYARTRYTSESIRLIDVVNERLRVSPYMGGQNYSIADIALYPWVARMKALNLPTAGREHILRWQAELAARPAVVRADRKALEIREMSEASRAQASAEDIDRIFGRGRFTRAG
jgi:GST-like protein